MSGRVSTRSIVARYWLGAGVVLTLVASGVIPLPQVVRIFAWIGSIAAVGAYFFIADDRSLADAKERRISFIAAGIVFAVALLARTVLLGELPQGAYVDEVFTMRNTLGLMGHGFDLFGQTPLIEKDWVQTSNLYLAFNSLIVRAFGVSYLTMKLFSAIPGMIACVFFYFACAKLFRPRLAFCVAILFALAHWHVRLSRYGWDASFLVMTLTAAVWLILASFEGRHILAFLSGVAAGLGLYSYGAGPLCVLSLGAMLLLAAIWYRSKADLMRLLAFIAGSIVMAAPLVNNIIRHTSTSLARINQVYVFGRPDWFTALVDSVCAHLLMFNVKGGVYARDNYPGLPMLDSVTGMLLVVGIVAIILQRRDRAALLLPILLLGTMAAGIFTVSQESPPYVYRASAAVVPAILIAGLGLQALMNWMQNSKQSLPILKRYSTGLGVALVITASVKNVSSYFLLEKYNPSAQRVMGVEYRLLGQAIGKTDYPTYLLSPGVFDKLPPSPVRGEEYRDANDDFPYSIFGPQTSELALAYFSGRYDWHLPVQQNLDNARIYEITRESLLVRRPLPVAFVLRKPDSQAFGDLMDLYAGQNIHQEQIVDSLGNFGFTLLTISPAGK